MADRILSGQMLILIGQILELRVEVALLKGVPLERAVDSAFDLLSGSPLLGELFDEEHAELLKAEFLAYFKKVPTLS